MKSILIPVLAALALGGCATKMQRALRGQPVAVAVAAIGDGAPDNAMDLPDGRRLFEWSMSDVIIGVDNGYDGDPRWWTTERQPLEDGLPDKSCVIKVLAKWEEARGTWIVDRYLYVLNGHCSMRVEQPRFRPISYLKD